VEVRRTRSGGVSKASYVVERLYRDAPLLMLGEGTNEIQQLVLLERSQLA
jgi:butyryl-CoA dehydrogenase